MLSRDSRKFAKHGDLAGYSENFSLDPSLHLGLIGSY